MRKVLLGCFLLTASITIFSETNVLSTLEQDMKAQEEIINLFEMIK